MSALLSIQDLEVGFRMGKGVIAQAVGRGAAGVSFDVPENTTVALVGESGSGKSITCLSMLGLLPSSGRLVQGQVLFKGRDLAKLSQAELQQVRGSEIGMIRNVTPGSRMMSPRDSSMAMRSDL